MKHYPGHLALLTVSYLLVCVNFINATDETAAIHYRSMKSIFLIFAIIFCCCDGIAQEVVWQVVQQSKRYEVMVRAKDHNAPLQPEDLQVYVGEYAARPGAEVPAILGDLKEKNATLIFQPTFSFRPGLTYTAFLGPSSSYIFTIPAVGEPPILTDIFPSGGEVPANLLKIYLHFSTPMGEGHAYEHLILTNAAGDTIEQPFVPLQPELWSEDRRRLTLWLDPGRVKRGLQSHETHGVVLNEGGTYSLTVRAEWKDVQGNRLEQNYQRNFRVTAPDYTQPDPENWSVQVPRAGSTEALVIDFGEPMDHALAQRLIRVTTNSSELVAGKATLGKEEKVWYFTPTEAWPAGSYIIRIDTDLEDLAGNNLNRPFDLDTETTKSGTVRGRDYVELPITVVPSN